MPHKASLSSHCTSGSSLCFVFHGQSLIIPLIDAVRKGCFWHQAIFKKIFIKERQRCGFSEPYMDWTKRSFRPTSNFIFITKMHLSKGLSSLERVSPRFLWEHLVHFPAHLKFWRSHTEREQKWVQPAAGTVIVTALWCYTNASAVQARTSKWNAALEQRHYALPCPALWHTAQPSCLLHNLAPEPLDSWLHKNS